MFDFRYHVTSLAAVFVALIIGILVGVGLSGQGFVTESERARLEDDIEDARARADAQEQRADRLERSEEAADEFAREAFPVLVADRLRGRQVALVDIGSLDDSAVDDEAARAIGDAGGRVVRTYALRVPLDTEAVQASLRGRPALGGYVGADNLDDLGRDIGRELVEPGGTPLLDALSDVLVEQRSGPSDVGADGVVVVRTAAPQGGATGRFVNGLYGGLATAGVPAVGVETTSMRPSAVTAFSRRRLSTVDDLDTPSGLLALVLLLAGAEPGDYGVKETADDGIVPPIEPLQPESEQGG
jgi:hypothetical protein